jgi:hypothetical protein
MPIWCPKMAWSKADCGRDESRSPKSAEATVAQLTISVGMGGFRGRSSLVLYDLYDFSW